MASTRSRKAVATAVYFVSAEALTNATKHSGATSVRIAVDRREHDVTVTVLDNGHGGANPAGLGAGRPARSRAGTRRPLRGAESGRAVHADPGGVAMRVIICEDHALVRDGLERLLSTHGFEIAASVNTAEAFLAEVRREAPDVLRARRAAAADVHR